MKLRHDPEANAAYLQLRERTGDLETVVVTDELNVDLLPDGTVYGIEFLNAAEQFGAAWDGHLNVAQPDRDESESLKVA